MRAGRATWLQGRAALLWQLERILVDNSLPSPVISTVQYGFLIQCYPIHIYKALSIYVTLHKLRRSCHWNFGHRTRYNTNVTVLKLLWEDSGHVSLQGWTNELGTDSVNLYNIWHQQRDQYSVDLCKTVSVELLLHCKQGIINQRRWRKGLSINRRR